MSASLKHILRNCKPGWSHLNLSELDVRKVMSIDYHKRLFCLFDRDHPYTLRIEYYNPRSTFGFAPVLGGRGGFVPTNDYEESSMITKRYMTAKDAIADIIEIERLQTIIAQYDAIKDKEMKVFAEKSPKKHLN